MVLVIERKEEGNELRKGHTELVELYSDPDCGMISVNEFLCSNEKLEKDLEKKYNDFVYPVYRDKYQNHIIELISETDINVVSKVKAIIGFLEGFLLEYQIKHKQ